MLEILGVADAELVLETAESLVDHDPKAALLAVERLSASGRDFTQFMRDLAAHLRHLFVVQTLGEVPDSFAVTAEHTDRVSAQADRLAQGEILRAIDLLAAGLSAVKDGSEERIQLELALLKAVQPQADLSLQALLFRIEQLERRVAQQQAGSEPESSAPPQDAHAAGQPTAAPSQRRPTLQHPRAPRRRHRPPPRRSARARGRLLPRPRRLRLSRRPRPNRRRSRSRRRSWTWTSSACARSGRRSWTRSAPRTPWWAPASRARIRRRSRATP